VSSWESACAEAAARAYAKGSFELELAFHDGNVGLAGSEGGWEGLQQALQRVESLAGLVWPASLRSAEGWDFSSGPAQVEGESSSLVGVTGERASAGSFFRVFWRRAPKTEPKLRVAVKWASWPPTTKELAAVRRASPELSRLPLAPLKSTLTPASLSQVLWGRNAARLYAERLRAAGLEVVVEVLEE